MGKYLSTSKTIKIIITIILLAGIYFEIIDFTVFIVLTIINVLVNINFTVSFKDK